MPADPALPVQLHGNGLARAALRCAGWKLRFDGLPGKQGVLIVYFFDYGRREVGVACFVTMSGDAGRDLAAIEQGLGQPVGRWPELAAPIRFEA
jgi:hypothetical protein